MTMLDIHHKGKLLWERTPEKTYELDGVEYSERCLKDHIKKAVDKLNQDKESNCKYIGSHLFMRKELCSAICPWCNTPIYNLG